MIDSFHLEAYGEKAVNYNRDLEVFPVVKRIIEKITGEESEYQIADGYGRQPGQAFASPMMRWCGRRPDQEIIRRYHDRDSAITKRGK